MKTLTLLLLALLTFSCSSGQKKETEENSKKSTPEVPIKKQDGVGIDGAYREYYPNGNVKIEGFFDSKGEKNGVWKGFSKNGQQQSEIFFLRGKKNGHAVVFLPSGKPKYIGEYKNDIKVGKWRFYDNEGNLSKEVIFD